MKAIFLFVNSSFSLFRFSHFSLTLMALTACDGRIWMKMKGMKLGRGIRCFCAGGWVFGQEERLELKITGKTDGRTIRVGWVMWGGHCPLSKCYEGFESMVCGEGSKVEFE